MAFVQQTLSNTITLKPGEIFTLPPGAKIKTVIGSGLQSDCADLPSPEVMSCYASTFSIVSSEGDPSTDPYESLTILGIRINQVDYLFDSNLAITMNAGWTVFSNNLSAAINSNPFLKGVMFNPCGSRFASSGSSGSQFVISFSGPDSLFQSNRAQLLVSIGDVGLIGGGAFDHQALFPIVLKSILNSSSEQLSSSCPCSSSQLT